MSEKAKRLAQEIQRNALKRMSYTGQGMTSQEEATLTLLEELTKPMVVSAVKPEEPIVIPPHAYDEKKLEEVKKLSQDKKTIQFIVNELSMSRSQVIRYRDYLGITKKRR